MIYKENCIHGKDNILKRKELKDRGFISSVTISENHNDFDIKWVDVTNCLKKFKNICDGNILLHCIELNISGTHKFWYKKDDIPKLLNKIKYGTE